jgi:hypothetical protein
MGSNYLIPLKSSIFLLNNLDIMVFHPAALSATIVSLIKAIFISEYANVITDPPFTISIIELLPYYIMVSNTMAITAQAAAYIKGTANVIHESLGLQVLHCDALILPVPTYSGNLHTDSNKVW